VSSLSGYATYVQQDQAKLLADSRTSSASLPRQQVGVRIEACD